MKKPSELHAMVKVLREDIDEIREVYGKQSDRLDFAAQLILKYLDVMGEEWLYTIDEEISELHAADRDEFNRNWMGEVEK